MTSIINLADAQQNRVSAQDRLLTTADAATYLNVRPRTMEGWRQRGGGPLFRKTGARLVRYAKCDLDAWLTAATFANTGQSEAA